MKNLRKIVKNTTQQKYIPNLTYAHSQDAKNSTHNTMIIGEFTVILSKISYAPLKSIALFGLIGSEVDIILFYYIKK
jgi:hypothetical protein